MTGERMQPMSCGHEVPQKEVQTHRHDDEPAESIEDEERRHLGSLAVAGLSVAGLTAVAFGLARRRLSNKEQE